jgi:hypothetical protein
MDFLKRRILHILRVHKKSLLLIAGIFLAARLVVNYQLRNSENRLIEHLHEQNIKVVQLLTPKYGSERWGFKFLGEAPFEACSVKNCFAFKSNVKNNPLEKSDAILVHAPDLYDTLWKRNYKRDSEQLWLFNSMESPENSLRQFRHDLSDLDDLFNLTVTYKPDSDLHVKHTPFDSWELLQLYPDYMNAYRSKFYAQKANRKLMLTSKTSRVESNMVFLAKDCTKANRDTLNFINKLTENFKIDVYGDCDRLRNTKPDPCAGKRFDSEKKKCYISLLKPYKFYLAAESGQCHHYISEHFWDIYSPESIFGLNIVPVVRGPTQAEYEKVAYQKSSFINANNFNSVESLASYLTYLSGNRTAFLEHLKWKLNLYDQFERKMKESKKDLAEDSRSKFLTGNQVDMSVYGPFCLACARLNDNRADVVAKKSVKISEWFSPKVECWETFIKKRVDSYFKFVMV